MVISCSYISLSSLVLRQSGLGRRYVGAIVIDLTHAHLSFRISLLYVNLELVQIILRKWLSVLAASSARLIRLHRGIAQTVCVSVCLSVCPLLYSRISRNYAANKRYERLKRHMGSKNKNAKV